jgi:hypothetical protein
MYIHGKQHDAANFLGIRKIHQRLAIAERTEAQQREFFAQHLALLVVNIERGLERHVSAGVLLIDALHDCGGVGRGLRIGSSESREEKCNWEKDSKQQCAARNEAARRGRFALKQCAPRRPAGANCGGVIHRRWPR